MCGSRYARQGGLGVLRSMGYIGGKGYGGTRDLSAPWTPLFAFFRAFLGIIGEREKEKEISGDQSGAKMKLGFLLPGVKY